MRLGRNKQYFDRYRNLHRIGRTMYTVLRNYILLMFLRYLKVLENLKFCKQSLFARTLITNWHKSLTIGAYCCNKANVDYLGCAGSLGHFLKSSLMAITYKIVFAYT